MPAIPQTKNAVARLQHLKEHLSFQSTPAHRAVWIDGLTNLTLDRDRGVLIKLLIGYCWAAALSFWYQSGDIRRVKNLFYNIGKLEYIGVVEKWTSGSYRRYTYTNTMDSMPIFVSDYPDLIQWCAESNFGLADSDRKEKLHLSEFFVKNIYLAMRKQWDELEERCRRYIANPKPRPYHRMVIFEFQFLLALATGDIPKMEAVLSEFVTPRGLRTYSANESAFTNGLINTTGLLFAKLAWQNGYEININSPYIPQEWLAVQPLEHYEDEFDFMKAYTIDPTWGATSV